MKEETVIVKTAPIKRPRNEWEMLNKFQVCPHIQSLRDEIEEPPALV